MFESFGLTWLFGFWQLSSDLIVDWIRRNPKASLCTEEGLGSFKDIANFQDYHGLPEFREVRYRIYGLFLILAEV